MELFEEIRREYQHGVVREKPKLDVKGAASRYIQGAPGENCQAATASPPPVPALVIGIRSRDSSSATCSKRVVTRLAGRSAGVNCPTGVVPVQDGAVRCL